MAAQSIIALNSPLLVCLNFTNCCILNLQREFHLVPYWVLLFSCFMLIMLCLEVFFLYFHFFNVSSEIFQILIQIV